MATLVHTLIVGGASGGLLAAFAWLFDRLVLKRKRKK